MLDNTVKLEILRILMFANLLLYTSAIIFHVYLKFAKFNIHYLISIYITIYSKGLKTLTLLVSSIHSLQNANFYSR